MTITRADTLTTSKKKTEFFSDFLNSFAMSPVGNQLARVTNEKAVTQSIRNLVLTNFGERLFQPAIGSNVTASLFELNTNVSMYSLEQNIQDLISIYEKRANIIKVEILTTTDKSDSRITNFNINEHYITVNIVYNLINNPEPISLNIFLKRVR